MDDRLYRSVDDRMLAGVAGGVAERLDADPSIIRIVWALLIILTGGIALIAYLVMAIVVPEDPGVDPGGAARPSAGPAPWPAPPGPATDPTSDPASDPTSDPVASTAAPMTAALGLDTDAPTVATAAASIASATPPSPETTGSWVAPDGRTVSRAQTRRDARRERRASRDDRGPLLGGLILILIGGFFLLRQFIPSIDLGALWPLLLVGIGVLLVIASVTPGRHSG